MENYLRVIRFVLPFHISSCAVTKEALQSVGGFPVGVKFGEDLDTFIRLSIRHKFVYINKTLAIYHRDAENRSAYLGQNPLQEYYLHIASVNPYSCYLLLQMFDILQNVPLTHFFLSLTFLS